MEKEQKIKTLKEVLSIFVFGLSLYLLYAIFLCNNNSKVGLLGIFVKDFVFFIFGSISYILPFVFCIYSIVLFKNSTDIKIKKDEIKFFLYFSPTKIFFTIISSLLIPIYSTQNSLIQFLHII